MKHVKNTIIGGIIFLAPFIIVLLLLGCAGTQTEPTNSVTYSYRCNDSEQAIVVNLAGERGFLFSREASQWMTFDAATGAFIGDDVYYRPDRPAGLAPGQTAEIRILGRSLQGCSNDPRAAIWEGAKLRGVSYRAIGQEPPWILEIHREEGFLLSTGYEGIRHQFPYTDPQSDQAQRRSRYVSAAAGESIVITIIGEPCHDSMSGEAFDSRVEIEWNRQMLRGCGRPLH
jgi:uncharacterized membrane protein